MNVTVLGANGPTGRLLTHQLISDGHTVTALTRHPEELRVESVRVVGGDATDPADLALALAGADAVASVLGTAFSRRPVALYSTSCRLLVPAMVAHGIRRLVVTSSAAAGPWRDPASTWLERKLVFRILDSLGRSLYDDMRRMEAIVSDSGLDWTIMRPLGLADMDAPTEYALAEDHIAGKQTARRDLAAAIADQLVRTDFVGRAVAVATTNKTASLPAIIWREGILPAFAKR